MRRFFDSDFILSFSLSLALSLSCLPVLVDLTSTADLATSKAIVYAKHVGDDILYKNSLHFFNSKTTHCVLFFSPSPYCSHNQLGITSSRYFLKFFRNILYFIKKIIDGSWKIKGNIEKIYWKILSKKKILTLLKKIVVQKITLMEDFLIKIWQAR